MNIPLFAFVIKAVSSALLRRNSIISGVQKQKAALSMGESFFCRHAWRSKDMLMEEKISCKNITNFPFWLFRFRGKIFLTPASHMIAVSSLCLHLNFPKRFKITFQYHSALYLRPCSGIRRSWKYWKYDGNLWTLIWLHLLASLPNKQSSYSNILW